jgi:hypothetical protein
VELLFDSVLEMGRGVLRSCSRAQENVPRGHLDRNIVGLIFCSRCQRFGLKLDLAIPRPPQLLRIVQFTFCKIFLLCRGLLVIGTILILSRSFHHPN